MLTPPRSPYAYRPARRKRRGLRAWRAALVFFAPAALERSSPLLPGLRLLPLSLHRGLLVVGPALHLLEGTLLEHLLLERLEGRLDLVVEDLNSHVILPTLPGPALRHAPWPRPTAPIPSSGVERGWP